MTGMISGSSIPNTVTTGTFTIPIIKKTGFSQEKAGAINPPQLMDQVSIK
ncbi:MAG: hypothetical protein CM15mV114_410 [Caudoviricetes sp.]|nr:MAG: hypothetical protein CM15mV114_410 [Caudoviricetes sp.]